jgi:hypothetical protein
MKRTAEKTNLLDAGKRSKRNHPGLLILVGTLFVLTTLVTFWRLGYLGGTSTSSASFMSASFMGSPTLRFSEECYTVTERDTANIEWSRCPLLWPGEEGRVVQPKQITRKPDPSPVGLNLSGTMQAEEGAYAFINGRAVSLGESVNGFELIEIGADYVLISPEGSSKTYTLEKSTTSLTFTKSKTSHEGGGR